MASPLSRRAFLAAFGGGVASAALAWGVWRLQPWAHNPEVAYPVPACCSYVDYSGWMLTTADKVRLLEPGTIQRLDGTMFEGHDLANHIVADVDACAAWCLTESECQGFTYAKPSHSDPNLANQCWLKGSSELTPVPDSRFVSGVR